MTLLARPSAWHAALLAIALFASGCASWRPVLGTSPVADKRKDRATDAVRTFEKHRDAAQLEAALDRWKQGDFTGAEARLAALVQRRPDFSDARLRLGEILWSRGDAAAAEPHLRAVLEVSPDRAEAHHALGLLLDATGRADDARVHLSRAAELEPDNEVYRLTCDSLASVSAPAPLIQAQ
jgi:predicted Zn-dependent protease